MADRVTGNTEFELSEAITKKTSHESAKLLKTKNFILLVAFVFLVLVSPVKPFSVELKGFRGWIGKFFSGKKTPTIVALIPARSGSKRVPDKNISPLAEHFWYQKEMRCCRGSPHDIIVPKKGIAAKAHIHNAGSARIEANAMGVPAVSHGDALDTVVGHKV